MKQRTLQIIVAALFMLAGVMLCVNSCQLHKLSNQVEQLKNQHK